MKFDAPRERSTSEAAFAFASYAIAFVALGVLAACFVAMVFE